MPPPYDIEMSVAMLSDQLIYFMKTNDEAMWRKFCLIPSEDRRAIVNRVSEKLVLVLMDEFHNVTQHIEDPWQPIGNPIVETPPFPS